MRFVDGFDLDGFIADDKTSCAATRCLDIISEATRRLSAAFQALSLKSSISAEGCSPRILPLRPDGAIPRVPAGRRTRPSAERGIRTDPLATRTQTKLVRIGDLRFGTPIRVKGESNLR